MAYDGDAGLAAAPGSKPHVVVTDIDVPVLSGIESALRMRSRLTEAPRIIVAVSGDSTWRSNSMAIAVFDKVIVKPVDVGELMDVNGLEVEK